MTQILTVEEWERREKDKLNLAIKEIRQKAKGVADIRTVDFSNYEFYLIREEKRLQAIREKFWMYM